MKRFYSKSTGCTYLEGVHTNIPNDATQIDEARYLETIANPPLGTALSHDEAGLPILIDPPVHVPTYQEELQTLNAEYQKDVEAFNKAFSLAILFDGASEEAKKATIREQYNTRKQKYTTDMVALKIKHGV